MSYLHTPRISFSGRFWADPSTINNNDSNFDPTVQFSNEPADGTNPLSNTSVYWNPRGTHNWDLVDCRVLGASTDKGSVEDASADKVIGATVRHAGKYPAKLVDLDPDNQTVSQIWGLRVQIVIPDPHSPASVTADLPPTAFGDLWNRSYHGLAINQIGMPTMSAVFQNVLTNVVWENETLSPILAALKAVSPDRLSLRMIVDSFQSRSTEANFTYGRLTGTIGPAYDNEPPRSTPRRLPPVAFWAPPPPPPQPFNAENLKYISPGNILSNYGPAGALLDEKRGVLVLDLGNCVPTQPTAGPQVPVQGWPVVETTFGVKLRSAPTAPAASAKAPAPGLHAARAVSQMGMKTGAGYRAEADVKIMVATSDSSGGADAGEDTSLDTNLGDLHFTADVFHKQGGIMELPLSAGQVKSVGSQPLSLIAKQAAQSVSKLPITAVYEDPSGVYVDVAVPFYRLNPGQNATVTLVARKFGRPWVGGAIPLSIQPVAYAANGPNPTGSLPPVPTPPPHPPQPPYAWYNGDPADALLMTAAGGQSGPGSSQVTVVTDDDGLAKVILHAGDPGKARMYPDGQDGPDGQVYFINIGCYWAKVDPQIFNFGSAQVNVLVFSGYEAQSAPPSWDKDVGPILTRYARMAPYMKGILDLADYGTVTDPHYAPRIQEVLLLPPTDPHHMPITRDLSAAKLDTIMRWYQAGAPKSPQGTRPLA